MAYLRALPLLLLGLLLWGCDAGPPVDADPDDLVVEPLQRGEALVRGDLQAESSARSGSADADAFADALADAPFGCLVSSPNLDAPGEGQYLYEAVRLRFPRPVVESAEGRRRLVQVVVGSTTLYADAPREAPVAVRRVRCLIPDSDRAKEMLDRAVRKFRPGRGERWEGAPMPGVPEAGAGAAGSGASSPAVRSFRSVPGGVRASASSGGEVCVAWDVTVLVYPDGSWVELSRSCVAYGEDIGGGVTVTADRGDGGFGSPDDGDGKLRQEHGDDSDPCAMAASAEEYLYCSYGPGSWSNVPHRPAEHPPATKAEVEELIRQTCPGQQPADLSGYFQASVRRSLNQAAEASVGFSYNQDPSRRGAETSVVPGVTLPVDGWLNDLRNAQTDAIISGYVTSILEVKFTEDPRNKLRGSQYRSHINDLARAYSAPGARVSGAPLYVLATNSRFGHIENLGPGSDGNRFLSYAAGRDVNVMHLRVTRDGNSFYLSGDMIGAPANFQSWVWDLVRDVEHPFVVSCTSED